MVLWTLVLGTVMCQGWKQRHRMEALYSIGKAEDRNQHPLRKGEGEIKRCQEEIHLKLKKLCEFLVSFCHCWFMTSKGFRASFWQLSQHSFFISNSRDLTEKWKWWIYVVFWSQWSNSLSSYSSVFLVFSRFFPHQTGLCLKLCYLFVWMGIVNSW